MSNFEISYPSVEQLRADELEWMLLEEEQSLSEEELAYQRRQEAILREQEAIGEMYASRYAFD